MKSKSLIFNDNGHCWELSDQDRLLEALQQFSFQENPMRLFASLPDKLIPVLFMIHKRTLTHGIANRVKVGENFWSVIHGKGHLRKFWLE